MITKEQIFEGATFEDKDGDLITIETVTPTRVYGRSEAFDFSARSTNEAAEKLNSWKCKIVGVNLLK